MFVNTVLILVSILLGVGGQLSMKQGSNVVGSINFSEPLQFLLSAFMNIYVVGGLFLYFLSSLIWIVVLSRVDLSFAYPLISIGYILVLLLSAFLFKEKVLPIHYGGVLLIVIGVFLITRGR